MDPIQEPASPDRRYRVGVALGGGSARGYAHIGALASLERHGFAPEILVGTSFGAVIGALYASGRSPTALREEAAAMRRRDVFPHIADFGLHKGALFDGRRLEAYFDAMVEGRSFEDLARPLVVVATDVDSGERVLLQHGPLAPALRASASIPGVFAPVILDGRRLMDGGIGSPVPLDTLQGFDVDLSIGIGAGMEAEDSRAIRAARRFLQTDVGQRLHRSLGQGSGRSVAARLGRALAYAADGWLTEVADGAALHVHTRPPIHWLNFHRAEIAIRAGDDALDRFMPRIRQAMASAAPV
ncbi:MAG: patatin-like phospholipase family protein [Deinococcales bacterium]